MSGKWTPGPWHTTAKHERQVSDRRGFKVAKALIRTRGANFTLPEYQAEANAHLIAAAPELYEALAQIEYFFGAESSAVKRRFTDARTNARAALAKARGEQ